MRRLRVLLLVAAAQAASSAFAQGLEASLVAGYTPASNLQPTALGISDLQLAGSFTWGAGAAYFFSPRFGFEASWVRQQSGIDIGTPDGQARMFDVNLDQIHGSFVWQFHRGPSRIRPFVATGLGVSLLGSSGLEDEAKLSFEVGAGIRWMATPRTGARFQVRYAPVHLADSSSAFCDPFGFCLNWLHQLELTGGVVVGF